MGGNIGNMRIMRNMGVVGALVKTKIQISWERKELLR